MTKCKFFEVKTGDNQGHYLIIENTMLWEDQLKIMGKDGFQCGAMGDYAYTFYKKHGCVKDGKLTATIWRLNSYGISVVSQEKKNLIQEKLSETGCVF